jgi:S-adenosylmethionine/arginine decarboxylase-like enzyme
MTKKIQHKHLLVNAKVTKPLSSVSEGINFLGNLVRKIDMKIVQGPFASYVTKDGNRGLTATVMIETSHIAFHIWDEQNPSMLQFDLYTCSSLDHNLVLDYIDKHMGIESMDWKLYDRENGFLLLEDGKK